MSCGTNCCRKSLLIVALFATVVLTGSAFAQNLCLQNEYNLVNKQKLNCTANDVRIAKVTNIRDPLTGQTLSTCDSGARFNFLADFEIVTTSAQARENVGLYIATDSTTQALTGSCVDNIISPSHPCPSNSSINCGSDNYHETDAAPDNCGDTSSGDNSATFGAGAEKVTLEIDNFLCEAPAGSNQVVLPNCTSWQIPGGTIQCVSPSPQFPYPVDANSKPEAIPGSPAKCNCGIISLAITVQTPQATIGKTCNTADNTATPDFTTTPPTPNNCTIHPEGGQVTYTVDVANKSGFGDIIVDQICDDQYGTIFRAGTYSGSACPAGAIANAPTSTTCTALDVASGSDKTCTFTVTQAEDVTVTDTVTVVGHGAQAGTFGPNSSNSVTVKSFEAPSSATVTKGVVSTVAACATERFSVDVANTSAAGTDENETLTALSDSAFGDITKVQGSVLATTCAIPAAGSSLTVGGSDYTCTFDAQFCSGVDAGGCISNTDKVTATISGDEAADVVSQTGNTITVKECLSRTVTSQ